MVALLAVALVSCVAVPPSVIFWILVLLIYLIQVF